MIEKTDGRDPGNAPVAGGQRNRHVVVLMGGWSEERLVSLDSGRACAKGLREAGYRVTCVDVKRNIAEVLRVLQPDVVFNALHGTFGEDGIIQGLLEILQIPYTHSGLTASAIAMNKPIAKAIFRECGIPVAPSVILPPDLKQFSHPMPPPYVIKPIGSGSSFGVNIVREGMDVSLSKILSEAQKYGAALMVERYISGHELTCTVIDGQALAIIEIVVNNNFYNYEAKYVNGGSKHILPAKISPNIYQNIQILSERAYRALGCRGVARVDFRFDPQAGDDTGLVCLEINTQPGMTVTSLVPEAAAYGGYDFNELVVWMIEDASCNR